MANTLEQLKRLEAEFASVEKTLADPAVYSDMSKYRALTKRHGDLEPIVALGRLLHQVARDLEEAEALSSDPEMAELHAELQGEQARLEKQLEELLLPKDPNDQKNIFLEIRAGVGGQEAALFAEELFRMYSRYAERQRWKLKVTDSTPTDLGGFSFMECLIEGQGVYSKLKYESGTHRVQRVPATEASGRIHTSTATVAVLPEVEEVDLELNPGDLRIDVYRSTGHGGQGVNTTDSAVRILHIPTGLIVTCQNERSQIQNKATALNILRSRLWEIKRREEMEKIRSQRLSQIGGGERAEKIRTYNFPQNRVTDHRIGYTTHNLSGVLDGDLDELIAALTTADRAQLLEDLARSGQQAAQAA